MIHIRDYTERANKTAARNWMFGDIPRRTSILTLPSQGLGCVEHMVKNRIIGPKTYQQWVERNQRIAKLLALRIGKHTSLHRGHLEDYEPTRAIDFANLDMECSFTERLGLWIEHKLAPKLLPNSYIILTVMSFGRNNPFLELWLPQQVQQGMLRDELHQLKLNSGCLNEDKLLPTVLLRTALHGFDVRRLRSAGYRDRDTADMLTVSFHIADRAPTTITPFSKIVADYRKAPIVVDRSHTGNGSDHSDLFRTVVKTLASMNFSMSPDDNGKWLLHNHDRAKTTLPIALSLEEIMAFFQVHN